ncbi:MULTISPECIES: YoaK family protein [unclassified Mycolicibacterium]|uniref:YoaK family protein n=1 Tax=unclassified Mycolicibacterium TaxID=2636767 RepID=UPI001F4C000F|nr:YoaK family protein [Mycolicibacterium sp. YH-1]UNB52187.1 DUF1275 domain-containing protein [Mycolicibacterium sp. YH-1]
MSTPTDSPRVWRLDPTDVHLVCMLVLTAATGVIDAVGFLGLDRVFTGNMTGNVAILGMALAGGDELPVFGPLTALASFMLGAALAGRFMRTCSSAWSNRTTVALTVVALMFCASGVVVLADSSTLTPVIAAGMLACGSGAQALVARHVAVKDVTTVVVTSTITGLAADSRLGAGRPHPWRRRAAAIALIGVGAVIGTLLLRLHLCAGIFTAAAVVFLTALAGHRWGRGTDA